MSDIDNTCDYPEANYTKEYKEQLLDEADRTVSGQLRQDDPRDKFVLEAEEERLRKIASSLIPQPETED